MSLYELEMRLDDELEEEDGSEVAEIDDEDDEVADVLGLDEEE